MYYELQLSLARGVLDSVGISLLDCQSRGPGSNCSKGGDLDPGTSVCMPFSCLFVVCMVYLYCGSGRHFTIQVEYG